MKLFGSRTETAVQSAEAAHDAAVTLRDRLLVQLGDTERELTALRSRAAAAALAEHNASVVDLAGDVSVTQATYDALAAAVDQANADVQAAERALAFERDRAERAASVAEVRRLIAQIEACSHPLTTAVADLVKVFAAARILRPTTSSLEAVLHASNLRHGIINDEWLE